MLEEPTLDSLLVECHRSIWHVALATATELGKESQAGSGMVYPPGGKLSAEESHAIRDLHLSDAARAALAKAIANACAEAFLGLFAVMDAVADPEYDSGDEMWLGVDLTAGIPDTPAFPMLHDAFLERYWKFKALTEERLGVQEGDPVYPPLLRPLG